MDGIRWIEDGTDCAASSSKSWSTDAAKSTVRLQETRASVEAELTRTLTR